MLEIGGARVGREGDEDEEEVEGNTTVGETIEEISSGERERYGVEDLGERKEDEAAGSESESELT
jgi:hypothetical protein